MCYKWIQEQLSWGKENVGTIFFGEEQLYIEFMDSTGLCYIMFIQKFH